MSAFINGFSHGFFHGMFGGTFWGYNCICNPFMSWNTTPMFFTPNYNFGNFYRYPTPTLNLNTPTFNFVTPNLNMMPSFESTSNSGHSWQNTYSGVRDDSSNFGDTFRKEERRRKNYSDSDTSNFSYDAKKLKKRWDKKKSGLSQEFYNKVVQISKRLNCSADDLMALMNSESGLDHTAVNKDSGATGLIQFMSKTAAGLGTSTEAIKAMTPEEQLYYVEKHLKKAKKAAGYKDSDKIDAGTLYAFVWLPGYANKDILATKENDPQGYYASNSGLDVDGDGKISKADLAKRIDLKRA